MLDFGALPPEINSARIYAGPGSGPLTAAATAWDELAAELTTATAAYRSIVSSLTSGRWLGPSSLSMATAFGPYVAWTAGAAGRAAEAASHARLAAEIYEAALVASVPPPAVLANRVQLAMLIATNFFGINTPAIAATEAEYAEMWAQDATAMYQYAANSVEASDLTPFSNPPEVTDAAGVASQTTAANAASGDAASTQASLGQLMSSVPTTLQGLANPMAGTGSLTDVLSGLSPSSLMSGLFGDLSSSDLANLLPNYLGTSITPLYGLSSVFGIAQSLQGLGNTAAQAAADTAGAAGAAAAAAEGAGEGVAASLGGAGALGSLSVPPAWTSVIPTAQLASVASPVENGGMGALSRPAPPSLLGGLPRVGANGGSATGPRYGLIPTVMAQPPSGGYSGEIL